MTIYTKTGDGGSTSLFSGERVSKTDIHIQTLGEIDELNSWIGLIAAELDDEAHVVELKRVQSTLHVLCAHVANPGHEVVAPPVLDAEIVDELERWIDRETTALAPLTHFILMGGSAAAARFFVARAVCRRAERTCVALSRTIELNPLVLRYLNRLSDLLFTLARRANKRAGCAEPIWDPSGDR